MNTNINSDQITGLPDLQFLESLANQFFKTLPNGEVADLGTNQNALLQQGSVKNMSNPQTSFVDPNFAGTGHIPQSVAGSGASPSAFDSSVPFDVNNPQTSLPDPHFEDGKIPSSVAGSGISPSASPNSVNGFSQNPSQVTQPVANQFGTKNSINNSYAANPLGFTGLPTGFSVPYESDLRGALGTGSLSFPSAQIPNMPAVSMQEAAYYFLSEKNHVPLGKDFGTNFSQKPPTFDINRIKADFPILKEQVNGKPLIWLDNAATTQKPKYVIDRIAYFYEHENSNIHRAAHELAARATDAYENARKKVQIFLNAGSPNEIVFVRGATEAINLVAKSWGDQNLKEGDEIVVSHLEHHANIVPWQQLAQRKGLKIRVIPVDESGQILLDEYGKLLSSKTKLVAFTQVSNALGTVTPAKIMIEMAHAVGAKVLLDGAQSVSHMRVDLQSLQPDWFVFSGHKVFAPTGIGVLYGKEDLLNATEPWQGGGNMILDVTFEHTQYQNAPARFEAGTGNIADAVGLGAALDYVMRLGIEAISQYEHYLLLYGTKRLQEVKGLRLIGTAHDKASVMSFVLDGFKNEDVGAALNREGIAVRSGHHCAQPILRRFGLEGTVRPSLAFYNTCADIDVLVNTLHKLASSKR